MTGENIVSVASPSPKNVGIARKTYCTSDPLSPGGPAGPYNRKDTAIKTVKIPIPLWLRWVLH